MKLFPDSIPDDFVLIGVEFHPETYTVEFMGVSKTFRETAEAAEARKEEP